MKRNRLARGRRQSRKSDGSFRPKVETLESRLQPGETLFTGLLGGSILGLNLLDLNRPPSRPERREVSQPADHHGLDTLGENAGVGVIAAPAARMEVQRQPMPHPSHGAAGERLAAADDILAQTVAASLATVKSGAGSHVSNGAMSHLDTTQATDAPVGAVSLGRPSFVDTFVAPVRTTPHPHVAPLNQGGAGPAQASTDWLDVDEELGEGAGVFYNQNTLLASGNKKEATGNHTPRLRHYDPETGETYWRLPITGLPKNNTYKASNPAETPQPGRYKVGVTCTSPDTPPVKKLFYLIIDKGSDGVPHQVGDPVPVNAPNGKLKAMVVSPAGETYLAGSYTDESGQTGTFIAKFDANDQPIYTLGFGFSSGDSEATSLAVDENGFGYLSGQITVNGQAQPLILKYNADQPPNPFNFEWGYYYPVSQGIATGIALGPSSVYLVSTIDNGNNLLLAQHNREGAGDQIWAYQYQVDNGAFGGNAIAVDGEGNSYVAGYQAVGGEQLAVAAKFSADGSRLVDGTLIGNPGTTENVGNAIAWDTYRNSAFVVGNFDVGGDTAMFTARISNFMN